MYFNDWQSQECWSNLNDQALHIWHLNLLKLNVQDLFKLLCDDEIDRFNRYLVQCPRDQFAATRGGLRIILSRYLDLEAEKIRFNYGQHGKPFIDPVQNPQDLHFSVSHSGGHALIALRTEKKIGVDIEQIRETLSFNRLAFRFFSDSENIELNNYKAESRKNAFYRCWTRKEALLKALGSGLSESLKNFDVTLDQYSPKISRFQIPGYSSKNWQLVHIHVNEDFAAALATQLPLTTISGYIL